MKVISKTHRVH